MAQHINFLSNNTASYEYWTASNGSWSKTAAYNGLNAFTADNWDYIVFQQNSGNSDDAATYDDLNALIDIAEAKCPRARYIWNMTWAYSQEKLGSASAQTEMYEGIVNAVQTKIDENERVELVMPVGTAIQNARSSFLGDTLHRDANSHLNTAVGRYTAALTFVSKLLGKSPSTVTWKPADVAADEARVAIESAENAIATPYAVTSSAITARDTISTDGGVDLALTLRGNTQWSSGSTKLYVYKDYFTGETGTTSGNYANAYASTQKFTRSELPVGTVIEIAEGFGYQPVGWKGNTAGAYGANKVTASEIVVDGLWWGSYDTVGFNIYRIDGTTYDNDPTGFETALTITVPLN